MKKKMYIITLLLFICCCFISNSVYANDRHTLTFAEAADLAVAFSADLRHNRASQSLLEGAWKWGLRAYFPRLGLSVSENDRLQEISQDSFMKNYGINLDQLLFDGGRTRMSRNLERMELNLSSSKLDRMESDIAESAVSAYRNVLSSRAILEIRKTALIVLEEQRKILNEEVQLGLALPVDLADADINLTNAKLDIFSQHLDLYEIEKQFAELLGLEALPVLTEKVDIHRSIILPDSATVAILAKERNPDLAEARYSVKQKQVELKYASNLWLPTLRLSGNIAFSGQHYPLTRYNWSVGINIDFSVPWLQNRISAQAGWEPPYDKTASVQNSLTPLPDPESGIKKRQAKLALALEQERFNTLVERIGRLAVTAVEKCALIEQKRILALEAAALGEERCRVEEIRLNLGQITRLKLMETLIEQTQKEIAAIEAATALLEAEHELESFLDLRPGELAAYAASAYAVDAYAEAAFTDNVSDGKAADVIIKTKS